MTKGQMKVFLCLSAIFISASFLLRVDGYCQVTPGMNPTSSFVFVGKGQTCDGATPGAPLDPNLPIYDESRGCSRCCKNFLSCAQFNETTFTCQEISQNQTCDSTVPGSCGVDMECIPTPAGISQCFFTGLLENGATCVVPEQCMSQLCGPAPSTDVIRRLRALSSNVTNNVCLPTSNCQAGDMGCCSKNIDCPAGYWCNQTGKVCTKPIKAGKSCADAALTPEDYEEISSYPSFVCASGSGCMKTVGKKSTVYTCQQYYSQSKSNPQCTRDNWWNCEFGLYCNVSDTDPQGTGTCIVTNLAGAIGDSCSSYPLSSDGQQECYWGTGCNCFSNTKLYNPKNSKNNVGSCTRMFNTNCEIQLHKLVQCIQSKGCPHDPLQLLGGNPTPFAASTIVGSCIQTKCSRAHANLIKCQNLIDASKYSPAYVPKTFPNNDYSNGPSGLAGWEIGLIIVGIAVAIIMIVVIVVAIVRKKSHSGYVNLD